MFDDERAIWIALGIVIVFVLSAWLITPERYLPDANGDCLPGTARNIPVNDDGGWCYPIRMTD